MKRGTIWAQDSALNGEKGGGGGNTNGELVNPQKKKQKTENTSTMGSVPNTHGQHGHVSNHELASIWPLGSTVSFADPTDLLISTARGPIPMSRFRSQSTITSSLLARNRMGALHGVPGHNLSTADAYWRMSGSLEVMLLHDGASSNTIGESPVMCWGSSGEMPNEWKFVQGWFLRVMNPCLVPHAAFARSLRYDFSLSGALFASNTPSRRFVEAVLRNQGGQMWGMPTQQELLLSGVQVPAHVDAALSQLITVD